MMATQYSDQIRVSVNSGRTCILEDAYKFFHTGFSSAYVARIDQGFYISRPSQSGGIRVLQPFYIKAQPSEEGFVATSDISDVYELGESPKQAILNYLYSLIDDLMWFLDHKKDLSASMLKDLAKLQFFIDVV